MKLLLITLSLGVSMFAVAGAALAAGGGQNGTLPGITVKQDANLLRTDCKPPAYARECELLHAQVRQVFNKREIALLFGASSALAEYRTNFASIRERYDDFLRQVDTYGSAPATAAAD